LNISSDFLKGFFRAKRIGVEYKLISEVSEKNIYNKNSENKISHFGSQSFFQIKNWKCRLN